MTEKKSCFLNCLYEKVTWLLKKTFLKYMRFNKLHSNSLNSLVDCTEIMQLCFLLPEIFQFAQENTSSHGKFFKADVLHIFKSH